MRFPITLQIGNKRSTVSVFDAIEKATDGKYYAVVEKLLSKTEFNFADGMLTKTAMESLYSQIYLLFYRYLDNFIHRIRKNPMRPGLESCAANLTKP